MPLRSRTFLMTTRTKDQRKISPSSVVFCFFPLLYFCASLSAGPPSSRTVELVAPLFIINADFMSLLTIRNNAGSPTDICLRFHSLEGEEVGHRLLRIECNSGVSIDLDGVDMVSHRFAALGSISLSASNSRIDGISARVTIASRNIDDRISVDENFRATDARLHSLEAAFVPDSHSVPVLAVYSLSTLPQGVVVDCWDGEGRTYQSEMTLPAGMTFLVNGCISKQSEGRTYDQVLRADNGQMRTAMNIQVRSRASQGGIVVWGFAGAGKMFGPRLRVEGIEFVERTR
jgi:hypothetical protein